MNGRRLKVAMVVCEARETLRNYSDPTISFGTAPDALLTGLAGMGECEVHVVSCLQQPVEKRSHVMGTLPYHPLVVSKMGWMRGGYVGCVRAIRKELAQIGPDLVHGQGTERYAGLAAAFSGYPSLLTIHGNQRRLAKLSGARPFSFEWLAARFEGVAVARVGGVICITGHTRNQVAGCPRTWVVPNAVDPGFFEVCRRPDPRRTILCAANIHPIKNQAALIRALEPLAQTESFLLKILGQSYPGHAYSEEVLGLIRGRDWCEYGGYVGRAQLREELGKASLLILPSLEDNCPMVLLEAMAAGVPVVASAVGGVPELVEEGETGFLWNPNELEALRSKVTRILREAPFAEEMSARAKRASRRRFHPEAVARRHVEIYREFLERDQRGRNAGEENVVAAR